MIVVQLGAGLGNNMFQYAAVKSLASAKKLQFAYCVKPRKPLFERVKEGILYRSHVQKQVNYTDLSDLFVLDKNDRILKSGDSKISNYARFQPKRSSLDTEAQWEIFDQDFFKISDNTIVVGGFHSEKFFRDNRAEVIKWFKLRPRLEKELNRFCEKNKLSPETTCCVHIRRGDYLVQTKGIANGDQGWALPLEYYKDALSKTPVNCKVVFVTDDPQFVRKNFSHIDYVISDLSIDVLDMLMFTKAKYNIIANSTFSWWGAYLNNIEAKKVWAPKYHLGWLIKKWIPYDIEVEDPCWHYIDIPGPEGITKREL